MKKRIITLTILIISALLFCGCISGQNNPNDELYQNAPIKALLEGNYEGTISCEELLEQGDLGLGTFDGLDGEMVVLDGVIYQVKMDGIAYEVQGSDTSPWAAVTSFDADAEYDSSSVMTLDSFESYIESLLPSQNICYAFRIDGTFDYVKTRSVPEQEKPYPRLIDVIPHQAVFEFNDVEGTMVGFWMPTYVDGINVPGFHIHFLTQDRTEGGHVLDATIDDVSIYIDYIYEYTMIIPDTDTFMEMLLEEENEGELNQIEK